jgi:hypothetical protein
MHRCGDKSIVQIGNALKRNTTLKSLNVYRSGSIGLVGQNCIQALLDGNKEQPGLAYFGEPASGSQDKVLDAAKEVGWPELHSSSFGWQQGTAGARLLWGTSFWKSR